MEKNDINEFFKIKYENSDFFKKFENVEYAYPNTHFKIMRSNFQKFIEEFMLLDNLTKKELDDIYVIFLKKEKINKSNLNIRNMSKYLYKKQKRRYMKSTKYQIQRFVGATNKPRDYEGEVYFYKKTFVVEKKEILNLKYKYNKLFKVVDYLFKEILLKYFNLENEINLDIIKSFDFEEKIKNYLNRVESFQKNYNLLLENKINRESLVRGDVPVYTQYFLKSENFRLIEEAIFLSLYSINKDYNKKPKYELDEILKMRVVDSKILFEIYYKNNQAKENSKKSFDQLLKKYEFLMKFYNENTKEYEFPTEEIYEILFILENLINRNILKQNLLTKSQILKNLANKNLKDKSSMSNYLIFYAREKKKIDFLKALLPNIKKIEEILEKGSNLPPEDMNRIIETLLSQIGEHIVSIITSTQFKEKYLRLDEIGRDILNCLRIIEDDYS